MKFKFNIGQPFFTFEARQVPGSLISRFSYGDFKVSLSHTSASSLEGFDNVFSVDLFIHVS